jgi:crossover junction endodeoxyribonuclease RuvC
MAANPIIIVGIDPGSHRTGFGILELKGDEIRHLNHGVIMLSDEASFAHRMLALGESLQMLLKKHEPQMISVEKIFLGKNPESAFQLGHARGVVLAEAARSGASLFEYATRSVKKGVTGNGGATKEEVQTTLQKILGLVKLVNLDASDALALAYFQCQQVVAERRQAKGMK